MAGCSDQLAVVLREGVETGDFDVDDPDYMANFLWTSTLGAMHLARIRVGLRREGRGLPVAFAVEPEQVVRSCVALAKAAVRRLTRLSRLLRLRAIELVAPAIGAMVAARCTGSAARPAGLIVLFHLVSDRQGDHTP